MRLVYPKSHETTLSTPLNITMKEKLA